MGALVGLTACGDDGPAPAPAMTSFGSGDTADDGSSTSGDDPGSSAGAATSGEAPESTSGPGITTFGPEETATTTGPADTSSINGGEESSTGEPAAEPPPCPQPQMVHFPVGSLHNIGYDNASCGTGTCEVSCPDINANSDWNGPAGHNGIDLFAHYQAPMLAVAEAEVVAVGTVSATSGLRVRIRDTCGWEYYYGHLDEAFVQVGDQLQPGDILGTMGATGTASVHLHFNVSFDGQYDDDIDPFDLLFTTSATVCE